MIVREVSRDRMQTRSHRAVNVDDSGLSFAGRVRHMRQQRGWSQQMLADAAGLSCYAVQTYEWERKEPSARSLAGLAVALNTTMDELWRGDA